MNLLLATAPLAMLEALCCFEIMRRLGFAAEVLMFGITPSRVVVIQLNRSEPAIAIPCGMLPMTWTFERAFERWRQIAVSMSAIDDDDFDQVWKDSVMRHQGERIALNLLTRGVVPPVLADVGETTSATIRKFVQTARKR